MNERDQVISFLFQACDSHKRTIEGLQKQVAELQKERANAQAQPAAKQK